MHRRINAPGIAPAFSAYSHAVETTGATRWLLVSGQVGIDPSGKLASDARGQMKLCWSNIFAILAEAGMGKEHIVKVTALLTDASDVGTYREERDAALDGLETASTMMLVAGLAHPDWKVEIEVTAAA